MSENKTTDLPRAPMQPAGWCVACPGCERLTDIAEPDWHEMNSGDFSVHTEARFPVCEYCGLQFEISAVQVVPADLQGPKIARLRDAHSQLDAWASSEISRLKAIIRVNALRWAPHLSHAEIDEVINGTRD